MRELTGAFQLFGGATAPVAMRTRVYGFSQILETDLRPGRGKGTMEAR